MEREIKDKIVRSLIDIDLETLENWLMRYTKNLHKLGFAEDKKEDFKMLFMMMDFMNIKNISILEDLNQKLEIEKLRSSLDLQFLEEKLSRLYTQDLQSVLKTLKSFDRGTVVFEGIEIPVRELEGNFSICVGNFQSETLSLGTNENLALPNTQEQLYGYIDLGDNLVKGMSPKSAISGESIVFDDFYGLIDTTRKGSNSVVIPGAYPSFVLALDEITEENKRAAKETGLPIYFIDREKLAIAESKKLEQIEDNFFKTFNPGILRRLIIAYFNNRNSFRDRKDLQEKYFDSLEMQVKLDVIAGELESCFDSKAERRAKLCLEYILGQLEKEEEFKEEEKNDDLNIKYVKKKIKRALETHQNVLIENTVNQAIEDIENMGDLTEIEKAYYMYLKLGTIFKHDPTYTLEGNRKEREYIYQYEIDRNGYGICKSMVDEYKKALKRLGIDSEITQVVPGGKYTHTDLIIKTSDGRKYFTNLIGDLSNIQNGRRIRNFAVGEKKIKGTAFNSEGYYRRIVNQIGDLTILSEDELQRMDEKFHHSYKGIYTNDMFQMLREEIKNKAYLAELFGTSDQDELIVKTFEFLSDRVGIVNSYNIENMGFYEATRYFDRLYGSVFDDEEKKHFRAFSDMYTIDENRQKKPGCLVVINVNMPNDETGKKENMNLYYEYSDIDKKFNRIGLGELMSRNYTLVHNDRPNESLNDIVQKMEKERMMINGVRNQFGLESYRRYTEDFDFEDK